VPVGERACETYSNAAGSRIRAVSIKFSNMMALLGLSRSYIRDLIQLQYLMYVLPLFVRVHYIVAYMLSRAPIIWSRVHGESWSQKSRSFIRWTM
jgi:hypothetical protein